MHRNTYLNSPGILKNDYSMINNPNIFFAGQMTGVEGYIESAGSGLVAGINAAARALGTEGTIFPDTTMIGSMASYVQNGSMGKFVPMNANFGIIEPLGYRVKGGKIAKYEIVANRALEAMDKVIAEMKK